MIYATIPQKDFSEAASDRASYLIANDQIRVERIVDDSSDTSWSHKNNDDEAKIICLKPWDSFMWLFKTSVRKCLGDNQSSLETPVTQNLAKISAAMGSLDIVDIWMRHRNDEQMQYIFKLTDHISLEIMSPLMPESEGEFYSVYYDGECQHMGADTIENIVDEMKELKDYLETNA